MKRMMICAAAAAALFVFAAPAEARIADPGLNKAAPTMLQDSHYRPYRHWHGRKHYRGRHHYRGYRYRHCRNERVRVRVPGGYFVWRTERRCAWRYR